MGDTGIPYATKSWSPVRGCRPCSEGCRNDWLPRLLIRRAKAGERFEGLVRSTPRGPCLTGKVRFYEDELAEPLKWRKPQTVATVFQGDLFYGPDEWIDEVFAMMALAPQHRFLVLTKRAERMRTYLSAIDPQKNQLHHWLRMWGIGDLNGRLVPRGQTRQASERIAGGGWPLPNVWLGVSVEDQATADARIPPLLQTPAAKRWVSLEPLLGPVDFCAWLPATEAAFAGNGYRMARGAVACAGLPKLDWIVAGGESGPGARPCDLAWLRALVAQCRAAGVPCYVKQDSGRKPGQQGRIPDDLWIKEVPDAVQEFPA